MTADLLAAGARARLDRARLRVEIYGRVTPRAWVDLLAMQMMFAAARGRNTGVDLRDYARGLVAAR